MKTLKSKPSIATLQPNLAWTKLPLFNRKNWVRFRFGDVVENVNERVEPSTAADEIYVGLDDLDPGSLHIRRWGKGSDVIGTKLRFRKGDIIFGRRRAYQRKLAVAEVDGICSAHAMVVRAKPAVVLPEFLPFLMMSDKFMNRAVDISVGSLSPTINWTTLKLEEFDLPPLDQQRRIAEILWAADEDIQCWQRTGEDLKALIEATMDAGMQAARNGQPPAGWRVQELGQLTTVISDGEHISPEFLPSGVPLISAKDVLDEGVDFSEARFISAEAATLSWRRCRPLRGDVLVVSRGATIGRSTSVNTDNPFALMGSVIQVRADEKLLLQDYLAHSLRLPFAKRQLLATSGSTAQQAIYLTDIKKLKVVVPPLKSQQDICAQVSSLSHQRNLVVAHCSETRSLRNEFLKTIE